MEPGHCEQTCAQWSYREKLNILLGDMDTLEITTHFCLLLEIWKLFLDLKEIENIGEKVSHRFSSVCIMLCFELDADYYNLPIRCAIMFFVTGNPWIVYTRKAKALWRSSCRKASQVGSCSAWLRTSVQAEGSSLCKPLTISQPWL